MTTISSPIHDALARCHRVGDNVTVRGELRIADGSAIELGSGVEIDGRVAPVVLETHAGGRLRIEDGARLEFGVQVHAVGEVAIGARATLGPNVILGDPAAASAAPVIVGAGAALGAGVQLRPGAVVRSGERIPAGTILPAPGPESTGAPRTSCRGILVADFTADDFAAALAEDDGFPLDVSGEIAPLGQIVPTLMQLASSDARRDFAVVWSRPEETILAYRRLLEGEAVTLEDVLQEVDAFAGRLRDAARGARFLLVASWVRSPVQRGLGMLDLHAGGHVATLMRMNLRLADALASVSNAFLLDAQRWIDAAGASGVKPRLWYLGKVPFGRDVFLEAARDVRAALRGALGMARKLIVVDLDDTMWGGIVGDVGWEGLRLGGHDASGEAFVDFQRHLLAVARRGVALAVVSKNEESVALEAMRSHSAMLVRPENLATYRINWRDKAQNIVEIAQELNLGLQSVVFIDDNPVERSRVREALPEVLVPEWPADPAAYVTAFESLRCFDSPRISDEDRERNAMYAVERQRSASRSEIESFDSWLAGLGVRVRFEPLGAGNVARATQLLNKTNQMNLRTRRLSEVEYRAWAETAGQEVWCVHVSDKFGDSGLTGLLALRHDGDVVHLEDYVLSCRVMGRRVEETLAWAAVSRARALHARTVVAELLPTAKNKPCARFWGDSGFTCASPDVPRFTWDLSQPFPAPAAISIAGLPTEPSSGRAA